MKAETEKEFLEHLGQRIKEERLKKGWTQTDLAAASDMDIRQITRIEKAQVNTSVGTIWRLTKALGIEVTGLC